MIVLLLWKLGVQCHLQFLNVGGVVRVIGPKIDHIERIAFVVIDACIHFGMHFSR